MGLFGGLFGGVLGNAVEDDYKGEALDTWEEVMTDGAVNAGQEALLEFIIPAGQDYIHSNWEDYDPDALYDEAISSHEAAEQALSDTIQEAADEIADIWEDAQDAEDVADAFA